mgnify:CR=1 FL=1
MGKRCERCGATAEGATGSPLALLDYCAGCLSDLCKGCMDDGCCGRKPAASGMEEDFGEGE